MNRCYRLLSPALLLTAALAVTAQASQIEGVRMFSDREYSRLSISFDGPFTSKVEAKPADKLVFVHFAGAAIDNLKKQSFVYDRNPHLESVTFLPLGSGEIVARVQARHDFRLKTYETSDPYRMILEISPRAQDANTPAGNSPFQYYQQGLRQMSDGNQQVALMNFRSAIRSGDHVADSYYQAGRIRLRGGELDKAKINFTRALESDNYGGEASLYLCWIDYKQGDTNGLKSGWREFIRRVPDAAGRFRIASNNPEINFRALEDATSAASGQALAEDIRQTSTPLETAAPQTEQPSGGHDAAWYFDQGVAAKQDGRFDAAAELLEKSIELDPSVSEAHFQLGVVYKSLNRKADSAREFQLSLEPPAARHDNHPAVDSGEEHISALGPLEVTDTGTPQPAPAFDEALAEDRVPENDNTNSDTLGQAGITGGQAAVSGPPPPAPATAKTGILAAVRSAAAGMVGQYGIGLLRRQVGILTALMGIIFLLTVLAERIVRRKWGKRNSPAAPGLPALTLVPGGAGSAPAAAVNRHSPVPAARRKQQVAQVLARELESKRRESRPAIDETEDGIELQLRPVGERGMYGVDIARRIKEELSPDGATVAPASSSALAGGSRDDMQTRLIRQLRSKNWTIGDIAQEMNLSREEIKWALAGNTGQQPGNAGDESAAGRVESYGQLRTLAARERGKSERLDPERIDREVDLELEINV